MISIKSNNQGTIIKVLNYKKWQSKQHTTEHTAEGTTEHTTGTVDISRESIDQHTTKHTTEHTALHTHKRNNKNVKEKVVESSEWLSDRLSAKEWSMLTRQYEDVIGLIDYVDNIVNDTSKVSDPFRYIVGIAEKKNWQRKRG